MQLDLNLLRALDVLLEEGSVSAAAERLHLSAPAMSRTLARLRVVTGDQILVRTGRTMTPTPFAVGVREPVHRVVAEAQEVLLPPGDLALATLDRTFTLQVHDAISTAVIPGLVAAVLDQAPGVRLRVLPEGAVDTLDLRHGRVDVHLGGAPSRAPEIRSQLLASDELVVVMRRGHPLGGRRLTARRYAAADHVTISRRGRLEDRVDELLAEQGLQRRVVAAVASLVAALRLLQRTDALALVTRRMCAEWVELLDLTTAAVPLTLPPSPVYATWHERYDADRAHRWLRELVADTVTAALSGQNPAGASE